MSDQAPGNAGKGGRNQHLDPPQRDARQQHAAVMALADRELPAGKGEAQRNGGGNALAKGARDAPRTGRQLVEHDRGCDQAPRSGREQSSQQGQQQRQVLDQQIAARKPRAEQHENTVHERQNQHREYDERDQPVFQIGTLRAVLRASDRRGQIGRSLARRHVCLPDRYSATRRKIWSCRSAGITRPRARPWKVSASACQSVRCSGDNE